MPLRSHELLNTGHKRKKSGVGHDYCSVCPAYVKPQVQFPVQEEKKKTHHNKETGCAVHAMEADAGCGPSVLVEQPQGPGLHDSLHVELLHGRVNPLSYITGNLGQREGERALT